MELLLPVTTGMMRYGADSTGLGKRKERTAFFLAARHNQWFQSRAYNLVGHPTGCRLLWLWEALEAANKRQSSEEEKNDAVRCLQSQPDMAKWAGRMFGLKRPNALARGVGSLHNAYESPSPRGHRPVSDLGGSCGANENRPGSS